MRQKRRKFSP